ncbi:MAG: hypothetical protein N4A72_17025 [Bacteroidales bacterium]|jgi:hypothetical protein|nr:hypothetical protein [Bacteroidales bacterium]
MKLKYTNNIISLLLAIIILSACNDNDDKKTGYVTFGANYDIINCLSTATIFIDNKSIGVLNSPTSSISDCGEQSNLTTELVTGMHVYKIEIRPKEGAEFTKDINGMFTISEGECEKIFIDYQQVFKNPSGCDMDVIISETEYQNAPKDPLTIDYIRIEDNCLRVKFNASGCDGNTWIVKLIDSGVIAESDPNKRTLRLSLKNTEECTAVPSKELTFNIEALQIDNTNKVILNISGKEILYEY